MIADKSSKVVDLKTKQPFSTSGGDGGSTEFERRLKDLEKRVKAIQTKVDGLKFWIMGSSVAGIVIAAIVIKAFF